MTDRLVLSFYSTVEKEKKNLGFKPMYDKCWNIESTGVTVIIFLVRQRTCAEFPKTQKNLFRIRAKE
jgi:hypothetical protein